jgi:hypothetical protein
MMMLVNPTNIISLLYSGPTNPIQKMLILMEPIDIIN